MGRGQRPGALRACDAPDPPLSTSRWLRAVPTDRRARPDPHAQVIVYPAMRNWGNTTETKMGCWDGYGQTGLNYALQSGGQMTAVMRMLNDIIGK